MLSYHKGDYVLRVFRNEDEMEKFLTREFNFHFTGGEREIAMEAVLNHFDTEESTYSFINRFTGDTRRLESFFRSLDLSCHGLYIYHDYIHDIDYCPPGVKED